MGVVGVGAVALGVVVPGVAAPAPLDRSLFGGHSTVLVGGNGRPAVGVVGADIVLHMVVDQCWGFEMVELGGWGRRLHWIADASGLYLDEALGWSP